MFIFSLATKKKQKFTWSLNNYNSGDTDLGQTERVFRGRERVIGL